MKFLAGLMAAVALVASMSSRAGPLGMQPQLGLASDYSSNPNLRADDVRAESHVAVLVDAPVLYDRDALHFSLRPSVRYSDRSGYSSLASNYFRVEAGVQLIDERGAIGLSGNLARDSSLTYAGESNRGVGVRRDTRAGAFDWQLAPTDRTSLQLDLSWTRVTYDQGAIVTSLTDYRYVSAAPAVVYALTERDSLKVLGGVGRYNSLDDNSSSKDYNLQLGLDRRLSEIWSVSASAGYSRSRNTRNYFFGPFFLGVIQYDQNSGVYNLSLKRTGESVSLALNLSRALRPTGFAFLSRQDAADLRVNYQYSEKWSFSAQGTLSKSSDPVTNGVDFSRRYFAASLAADWHWTPGLFVTLRASRVAQRYNESRFNGSSSGVSLELNRQFNRVDLGQ